MLPVPGRVAGLLAEQFAGHIMLGQQLALLAFQVEKDESLAFGQRLAYSQHAGFQRGIVAVVSAVAGNEVLDQAGQGFGLQLVVGDQHGRVVSEVGMSMLRETFEVLGPLCSPMGV